MVQGNNVQTSETLSGEKAENTVYIFPPPFGQCFRLHPFWNDACITLSAMFASPRSTKAPVFDKTGSEVGHRAALGFHGYSCAAARLDGRRW